MDTGERLPRHAGKTQGLVGSCCCKHRPCLLMAWAASVEVLRCMWLLRLSAGDVREVPDSASTAQPRCGKPLQTV